MVCCLAARSAASPLPLSNRALEKGKGAFSLTTEGPILNFDTRIHSLIPVHHLQFPLNISRPPSTAMDAALTHEQKAKLHEVADLVLQIYHTLARMRHLDADWIQPGPHDVSALGPLYASLGLDPRVVYLYGILPYVNPQFYDSVDFVQGTSFADFRTECYVRTAREFFEQDGDPGWVMRPWMTALSGFGERSQLMMYDAERHVVHLLGDFAEGSWDHNLDEGTVFQEWSEERGEEVWYYAPVDGRTDLPLVEVADIEEWRRKAGWYGEEKEEDEGGEGSEGGEDGCDGGCEDEGREAEDEQEIYWDEMKARPAGRVLRDIVRWYHELAEIPGDGRNGGAEWCEQIVRPLYRRHGWPGENFDGDAFLADQARSTPPEVLFREVAYLECSVSQRERDEGFAAPQRLEKLEAAKNVGEAWVARWEIWIAEQNTRWLKNSLRRAEEWKAWGEGLEDAEGPPLKELEEVRGDFEWQQRKLNELKQELEVADPSAWPQIQEHVRYTEKMTAIYQKAYEATQADAERVGPGKPLSSLYMTDIKVEAERLTRKLQDLEREVAETRDWAAQLPGGADEARRFAQECVAQKEKELEHHRRKRDEEVTRLNQKLLAFSRP